VPIIYSFAHPYQFEIENIEYPSEMQHVAEPIRFENLEKTPLHWIDNLAGLGAELSLAYEFDMI
jgi:hypothetical protein